MIVLCDMYWYSSWKRFYQHRECINSSATGGGLPQTRSGGSVACTATGGPDARPELSP